MNSDKELLGLAYKASGYNFETKGWVSIDYDEPQIDYIKNTWYEAGRAYHDLWNPLTDDGDALRLAVKLGITASPGSQTELARSRFVIALYSSGELLEERGKDPYAATRRAIVRAAAEIGRSMG